MLLRPFFSTSFQNWLKLRNHKIGNKLNYDKSIWFHASSGEIEYCKSVIRLLKEQAPEKKIVVTYSSPSAERLFHNIKNEVSEFIPLPWDQSDQINSLINYINPQLLIFSRTDLWPELVQQIHNRHIKMGVISFASKVGFYNLAQLKKMSFISCVDENTKILLNKKNVACPITVDGDTRFDQVFYRLSQPSKLQVTTDNKIFVCGSTWPEDESHLLPCFQKLLNLKYKIILSPHEVEAQNIKRLGDLMKEIGVASKRLSELVNHQTDFSFDVLLIDKIGFLPDCYRGAQIAFVGGSFKAKVHSVMEALCCGIPVLTGPYYENSPEAVKYQGKFVHKVLSSDEVLLKVKAHEQDDKEFIKNEMLKNKNASEKILNILLKNL